MDAESRVFETELVALVAALLRSRYPGATVSQEELLADRGRPDLILRRPDGAALIVEVKNRGPQTGQRIERVVAQLRNYQRQWQLRSSAPVELALVVPDVVAEEHIKAFAASGIQVWDRDWLAARLDEGSASDLPPEDVRLLDWILRVHRYEPEPDRASTLTRALQTMPAGRSHWSDYQRLCADVLTYLFCPPLELPLYESETASRVNRRDIVLPNYANEGFWEFVSRSYRAEYVVVDAKNLRGSVTKTHVLQLANYLSEGGTGLLGFIVTRGTEDRAALSTRREQWLLHRKMMLVLNDLDLAQMLVNKSSGGAPEEVIRQKIQDFRLAI